jgi:opacity protein-like surface antigen
MRIVMQRSGGARSHGGRILAGIAFAMACSASSGAFAQCTTVQSPLINNLGTVAFAAGSTSAALAGAIGNVSTAFLTQQGSAFVSAPANPAPDQPGGGIWARAVGGQVTDKSTTTGAATATGAGINTTAPINCNTVSSQNFAGVQVGADIARLNWNGWNVHLGTTAGYLGANSTDNIGFSNSYEVPFIGTYVVATKGRFFADLMVREEFYNTNLSNTVFSLANQPVGAHGYSVAASAGYNFDLGNNWFIEPSAGFIYSDTSVDNFTLPGSGFTGGTNGIPFTISTNDVISEIGRASLRVGKTIETPGVIWQPFASASVFNEFAGNVVSNFVSAPGNAFCCMGGTTPISITGQTSTSRIGTYGQYSLGVSGQIVNTGWLGFVRVDYRDGANINGWTGNAGIRYQFTPEMIASVMPTKAVKAPRSFVPPTNWTGFYVGGFAGAAYGRTSIEFPGSPSAGAYPWVFGGLGGGEIGYNRQLDNNWVVGVEGDVGAANVRGGRTAGSNFGTVTPNLAPPPAGTYFPNGFNSAYFVAQDQTNWMATATGRVGYTFGRTLFYAKGGAAFEDSTVSVNCFNPGFAGAPATSIPTPCFNQAGAPTNGFSTSSTRVGWTLGFGTEFDLGKNWSAKTEYDYLSFGSHTATATDGTTIITDKSYISQVKVGLNYRFSADTVVAKY